MVFLKRLKVVQIYVVIILRVQTSVLPRSKLDPVPEWCVLGDTPNKYTGIVRINYSILRLLVLMSYLLHHNA